ncbi:MAG: methylmalonyl-CoA mutase [Deltaproteobacteria bacterium]|nr:MAG: methylmalonyl-CoA mutase [Deltaproteobacteria bacterium]
MAKKVRILTAKMGLDCHDTGITTLSQILRDAGFEVIYLGLHNSAEKILRSAVQEGVDLIGLSFLSGQHLSKTRMLLDLMKKEKEMVPVFVGGVIPPDDVKKLEKMGVKKVFIPGTVSSEIIQAIQETVTRE